MFISFGIGFICVLFGIVQFSRTHVVDEARDSLLIAGFIPFYWMVLLVGGLILLTLVYVGIRKFIGQKRRGKNRSEGRK